MDLEPGSVVSALEVLQSQSELKQQAARIAKAGELDACTYSRGYVSQPVYSCLTCNPPGKLQAGFCFGCSMTCHALHDVVELFEKRHFRCDCGNACSGQAPCHLLAQKEDANPENQYTHNFDGLYCYCGGVYDPDVDEMVCCFLCQDWFHSTCIGLMPPADTDYFCELCLRDPAKAIVAHYFNQALVCNPVSPLGLDVATASSTDTSVDTPSSSSSSSPPSSSSSPSSSSPSVAPSPAVAASSSTSTSSAPVEPSEPSSIEPSSTSASTSTSTSTSTSAAEEEPPASRKRESPEASEPASKRLKQEQKAPGCTRPALAYLPADTRGLFVAEEWRERVCLCESCAAEYRQRGLGFLVDEEDSCNLGVLEAAHNDSTEDLDVSNSFDPEALGEQMLARLPHGNTMNAVTRVRSWIDQLKGRLAEFHTNNPGAVITKEVMDAILLQQATNS